MQIGTFSYLLIPPPEATAHPHRRWLSPAQAERRWFEFEAANRRYNSPRSLALLSASSADRAVRPLPSWPLDLGSGSKKASFAPNAAGHRNHIAAPNRAHPRHTLSLNRCISHEARFITMLQHHRNNPRSAFFSRAFLRHHQCVACPPVGMYPMTRKACE